MSYIRPLVEQYRVTRFAHIERRQDALNQECNVINDVTGKSHSTHATMEGAKHSLSRLDLRLRLEDKKRLKKVTLKLA
jgi:hypothetical protein